ncbi:MAG: Hsp70 family protein [Nannocystaceae bacterium]|nr:Hsp70 family protein [Nannocystaceae bacterium]
MAARNIIGIDLGTTYSLVARMDGDRAIVLPNRLGETQTPSAVSITAQGEILVGAPARARAVTHPDATFRNFKRDMGTDRVFAAFGLSFRAEELSAMVLKQLAADAEEALGGAIDEAVVTVPAYFGELQRRATRDACEIAELYVERIINEPTAAALAYGLDRRDRESRIAILDLGGGTFDVSVLEIIEGVIEIQGTAGDARLGGEDFLEALVDHVAKRVLGTHGFDPRVEPATRARLLETCEQAKRRLSTAKQVDLRVPTTGEETVVVTVTRDEVERLWQPTLQKLHAPIRRALRDACVLPRAIDEVVLVGGATRMPAVQQLANELFGRTPLTNISPDEAVAHGAAIQVGLKSGDPAPEDMVATDIAPFSIGVSTVENRGRRTLQGVFSPILERGTVLPASRVERFVTAAENQTQIKILVYQGEHSSCEDNTLLGEYELEGIHKGAAGEENIDVRFSYDLNGLLEVDMTVVSTAVTKTLVVERSGGKMTQPQLADARDSLQRLKFHPRDALPNTTALARAESAFVELRGAQREALGHAMRSFRLALEEQRPTEIEHARRQLMALLGDFSL